MRTAQDAKRFPIEQLESMFSRQKAEEKAFNALPTLQFRFIIMSDDRDLLEEDSEDPHQKYSVTGYGKTKELAQADAEKRFHNEWGSDLTIYWIRDYDRPF
jgi:hypothetical protein